MQAWMKIWPSSRNGSRYSQNRYSPSSSRAIAARAFSSESASTSRTLSSTVSVPSPGAPGPRFLFEDPHHAPHPPTPLSGAEPLAQILQPPVQQREPGHHRLQVTPDELGDARVVGEEVPELVVQLAGPVEQAGA